MTNDFRTTRMKDSQSMLSKEEYAEKKKAEKEEVYQMIDETAVAIVKDPQKFRGFLDTQSRMDRYSAANALLIYRQFPEATQLKSFDDWNKDNVKISKGARSISVLEPVEYTKRDGTRGITYNVKKMFDVSQTNARKAAVNMNRNPKMFITVMLDISPIRVELADELPKASPAAFYDNDNQVLYVRRNAGDSVIVAQNVAYELGHVWLSMQKDGYSRRNMAFQAMCIGYMLCKKHGVDTSKLEMNRVSESLSLKEPKEIRAELGENRSMMSEIHSRISEEMYRRRETRSNGRSR